MEPTCRDHQFNLFFFLYFPSSLSHFTDSLCVCMCVCVLPTSDSIDVYHTLRHSQHSSTSNSSETYNTDGEAAANLYICIKNGSIKMDFLFMMTDDDHVGKIK